MGSTAVRDGLGMRLGYTYWRSLPDQGEKKPIKFNGVVRLYQGSIAFNSFEYVLEVYMAFTPHTHTGLVVVHTYREPPFKFLFLEELSKNSCIGTKNAETSPVDSIHRV